jgi:D-alanine--poly(phosphoribitol) ligase subunit 1
VDDSKLRELLKKSFLYDNFSVLEEGRKWKYSEFWTHAFAAMNYFVSNNIKRATICLPQSFYSYAIIWGAYLSHTIFCPVNVKNPIDRILYFNNVFESDVFISDTKFDDKRISAVPSKEVFLFSDELNSTPPSIAHKSNLAYVIFTSGSTGLPKGVKISRESLESFLLFTIKAWDITKDDVVGQYSSIGFDLSIADIFVSILCGATLVPFSDSEKLMPGKTIRKYGITFWHSVPSAIDLIDRANQINNEMLGSLRKASFCGEQLYKSQLDKLFTAKPDLIVFNTYGPTEATVFCSLVKLNSENYKEFSNKTVTIGDAIDGMRIELVGMENGIGEICISGRNVSLGYLGASTKEESPFFFTEIDGLRSPCYYTGDYAYYENNHLFFQGRKDGQIKRMGNRIDLSEIDYWIRELGCSSSCTVAVAQIITSFVETNTLTEDDVLYHLRNKLPNYYIPQRVIIKKKLPLNSSGKIDRNKLFQEALQK